MISGVTEFLMCVTNNNKLGMQNMPFRLTTDLVVW